MNFKRKGITMDYGRRIRNMLWGIGVLVILTVVISLMGGVVAKSTRNNTMKSQDGYQQIFDKLKPGQEVNNDRK